MKIKSTDERIAYVYKVTSPIGAVYIGSTLRIISRKSAYKINSIPAQRKLHDSILKYGWESHTFEVIKECLACNMRKMEAFYGFLHNSLDDEMGLNCNLPKYFEDCESVCQETIQKMGSASKGRKHTKEWVDNLKIKMIGNKYCENTKNHSKMVLDTITGIFYDCAVDAAIAYGINKKTIHNILNPNHHHTNKTTLIYI